MFKYKSGTELMVKYVIDISIKYNIWYYKHVQDNVHATDAFRKLLNKKVEAGVSGNFSTNKNDESDKVNGKVGEQALGKLRNILNKKSGSALPGKPNFGHVKKATPVRVSGNLKK